MLQQIQSISRPKLRITDSVTTSDGVTIPCITGQTGQVDLVSQNGYRYKKGFWDKVLSNSVVKQNISNRNYLGTIEHPEDDAEYLKTPYKKASHVVIKAWCQEGNPYAILGLLNNDNGNAIKALIDVGHRPGVSTRGLGDFDNDSISKFVVDDNYCFLGWDIVTDPNFSELNMSAAESIYFQPQTITDSVRSSHIFKEVCQMYQLRDSADTSYNKDNLKKCIADAIYALQNLQSALI